MQETQGILQSLTLDLSLSWSICFLFFPLQGIAGFRPMCWPAAADVHRGGDGRPTKEMDSGRGRQSSFIEFEGKI
ncbi:uncharacterized protein BDV14DRAFT_179802 [Aspergillus stella-maris]|uniref:uncharacterized protein n=1 Tax=Aspergillus stella-maris TaxID=1810926 RepID=UPI003CCDF161